MKGFKAMHNMRVQVRADRARREAQERRHRELRIARLEQEREPWTQLKRDKFKKISDRWLKIAFWLSTGLYCGSRTLLAAVGWLVVWVALLVTTIYWFREWRLRKPDRKGSDQWTKY